MPKTGITEMSTESNQLPADRQQTGGIDKLDDTEIITEAEFVALASKDIFPPPVKERVESVLKEGERELEGLNELKQALSSDGPAGFQGTWFRLEFPKLENLSYDLACTEWIELKGKLHWARNQCLKVLGREEEPAYDADAGLRALKDRITKESLDMQKPEVASHVTGYTGLVSMLEDGRLLARKLQEEKAKGELVTTFAVKGEREEHQIVFDMDIIRPKYALDKDPKGRQDPVIVLARKRDLMTQYQHLSADGLHFFGPDHDPNMGKTDPFQMDLNPDQVVILVPEVYRSDLVKDLQNTALRLGLSIEGFFQKRGLVFIEKEQYTIQEGPAAGSIFTGEVTGGQSGVYDRAVVKSLQKIGQDELFAKSLPRIVGRLVPTGRRAEGLGGYWEDTYIFKTVK